MLRLKTNISCETSSTFTLCIKLMFSYEFSHELQNRRPRNRCFVRGFRVNFHHHMSQNATPATQFARGHHLMQPWQCDSQKTRSCTSQCCSSGAPETQRTGAPQGAAPATNTAIHLPKRTQKYCACHEVPLLPREMKP